MSKKVTKPREYWIHHIIAARETEGDFNILYLHFEKESKKFFNYFRMPNFFVRLKLIK